MPLIDFISIKSFKPSLKYEKFDGAVVMLNRYPDFQMEDMTVRVAQECDFLGCGRVLVDALALE